MINQSIVSISLRVLSIGMIMFINILLARNLGPIDYGVLSYGLAWMQILMILVQFGLPAEMTRSVALSASSGSFIIVVNNTITAYSVVIIAWIAVVSMVLLATFARGVALDVGEISIPLAIIALTFSFVALNAGILRGMGLVVRSQIPEHLVRPIIYVIGLATFLIFGSNLTVVSALWIQVAATVVAWVIGLYLVLKILPLRNNKVDINIEAKSRSAFPFLILSVVQILATQLPIVFVGSIESSFNVALLRVAMQIADSLNIALLGIATVIGPRITQYHANAEWPELRRLLARAHLFGFIILLFPVFIIGIFSKELLTLTFGVEFAGAHRSLLILLVGKAVYSLIGFAGLVLVMIGKPKAATIASIFSLLAMLAMLFPLTLEFGQEGAAFALALSGVFTAAVCFFLYPAELKMRRP